LTSAEGIAQDARELRRGVLVNYLGYALKVGMPVLLALVTRAYGAEQWGKFVSSQAMVVIVVRLCLVGLDKGLLWAIPARDADTMLVGVGPALRWVGLNALAASLVLWFGVALLPLGDSAEPETLRVCALGILPFALSELLLHAAMGQRRMELQVAVRETLNPLLQVGVAYAWFQLGGRGQGLAWSFVVSHYVGMIVAWLGFRRMFRGFAWPRGEGWRLPRPLLRYSAPMALADTTNSLLLRLDTIVLTALTDPVTVGVWGIVGQFANALRQLRRAYDPMVTAITARIAVRPDPQRLSETFSYAAQMVSLTQLPVFAALALSADLILPFYGPDFVRGTQAMIVLSGFFLVSGGAGLSGLVVSGFGRSGLTLFNVLLSFALQLGLLLGLVPLWGLTGGAVAVGASMLLVNFVQLAEMRMITGAFHYTRRTTYSLAVVAGCTLATSAAVLATQALDLATWVVRTLGLLAFAATYAGLYAWGLRRGALRAPG
jgi:O-antigen/teichoic acid export membrane protein